MKNKRILVTGGAGFIGSNLIKRLCKDNIIYSLDNYSIGSYLNHVDNKNVTYLNGNTWDINDGTYGTIHPDIIFHLGEYSRVEQSFEDIIRVQKSNSVGTFEVLQYARKYWAKLIYAGSSTKFGNSESPYSFFKKTNTELVSWYGDWYNLDYAITYFYNVYGPGESSEAKYGTVLGIWSDLKKKGEPLRVTLPGTQKRNFTHIEDTINGLVLVGEKGKGDNHGIGSPESFTILEVAQLFDHDIILTPEKKGNRTTALVVTDKTRALGWKPTKHLKDYINEISNINTI